MLLLQLSSRKFRIPSVCFKAEYCNKPGKQALFLLIQTFNVHLFVWVCGDLPEIQDKLDLLQNESHYMSSKKKKKKKVVVLREPDSRFREKNKTVGMSFRATLTHTCTGRKKENKHTITS